MPGTDLLLFAELQRQRLQAALVSTTPRQTFTAGPKVEVFLRTPAHRMSYSDRTAPARWEKPHGTMASYVHLQCRCRLCTSANSAYRRTLLSQPRKRRATPAECGTTKQYRRGCRCFPCVAANRRYGRDWHAAHPPNEAA